MPEPVKRYLISLWSLLNAQQPNLAEIQSAYDAGWNRISDKFYSNKEWPEAEVIAPLVNYDELFLTLYKELYFKHILARLQPTLEDRISSYENYCALANTILNSPQPVPIALPVDWLYNMSVRLSLSLLHLALPLADSRTHPRSQHRRVRVPVHELYALARKGRRQDGRGEGHPRRVGSGASSAPLSLTHGTRPSTHK